MDLNLKQLINILNNNSSLELRFIYSKKEYDKYQIGDLISVYGFKAKIIKKQEYLRANKYTASITYKILARVIVEGIEE